MGRIVARTCRGRWTPTDAASPMRSGAIGLASSGARSVPTSWLWSMEFRALAVMNLKANQAGRVLLVLAARYI